MGAALGSEVGTAEFTEADWSTIVTTLLWIGDREQLSLEDWGHMYEALNPEVSLGEVCGTLKAMDRSNTGFWTFRRVLRAVLLPEKASRTQAALDVFGVMPNHTVSWMEARSLSMMFTTDGVCPLDSIHASRMLELLSPDSPASLLCDEFFTLLHFVALNNEEAAVTWIAFYDSVKEARCKAGVQQSSVAQCLFRETTKTNTDTSADGGSDDPPVVAPSTPSGQCAATPAPCQVPARVDSVEADGTSISIVGTSASTVETPLRAPEPRTVWTPERTVGTSASTVRTPTRAPKARTVRTLELDAGTSASTVRMSGSGPTTLSRAGPEGSSAGNDLKRKIDEEIARTEDLYLRLQRLEKSLNDRTVRSRAQRVASTNPGGSQTRTPDPREARDIFERLVLPRLPLPACDAGLPPSPGKNSTGAIPRARPGAASMHMRSPVPGSLRRKASQEKMSGLRAHDEAGGMCAEHASVHRKDASDPGARPTEGADRQDGKERGVCSNSTDSPADPCPPLAVLHLVGSNSEKEAEFVNVTHNERGGCAARGATPGDAVPQSPIGASGSPLPPARAQLPPARASPARAQGSPHVASAAPGSPLPGAVSRVP